MRRGSVHKSFRAFCRNEASTPGIDFVHIIRDINPQENLCFTSCSSSENFVLASDSSFVMFAFSFISSLMSSGNITKWKRIRTGQGAVFKGVSWVNSGLLWFNFTSLSDLLRNSRHFLSQTEVEPKPILSCLHALSRAWRLLHVFASNSDWFIVLFTSFVIGQSGCFCFGFTILNWKSL